mmetsp:Transcript_79592/g.200186  ORF Transcript_79592/g.200186 Transcript_79592/m.200186 type:complete len:309 (-) Transcript_79592:73-999(-)
MPLGRSLEGWSIGSGSGTDASAGGALQEQGVGSCRWPPPLAMQRRPKRNLSDPAISLRVEAEREGWIPVQVSWLNSREKNPLQRQVDLDSSPTRRFSDATMRLSSAGYRSKMARNTKTEVEHQVVSLEQVMKSRMRLYENTRPAVERAVVDGEGAFPEGPLPPTPLSAPRPRCIDASPDAGAPPTVFLRPQRTKGIAGTGTPRPSTQLAQVNHGGSTSEMERPWTTSHAVPTRQDPDEPGSVWDPLLIGGRPWASHRDQGMQQMLAPQKGWRRLSDSSSYGSASYINAERNVFYMTLNSITKPQIRGF